MTRANMKVGVVGCGYWGPNLVRNLVAHERCDDVVCCDTDVSRLKLVKRRYPSVSVLTDADAMLADETVDAVMVATPLTQHYPLARAALNAGKHVFVEKPFTGSSVDARELIGLARARGRTLMVGHTFLYSAPVRKIKELISRGELGDIHYIAMSRVNLGLHQTDISVVWDLAPHDFSMLLYWLDELPIEVTAMGQAYVQSGIPDVAFINLRYPSGTICNVNVSWLSPSKIRQTTIVGSRKMLIYDDTSTSERVKIFDKGVDYRDPATFGEFQLSYRTGDVVSPRLETAEPLSVEIGEFLRAIETGRPPLTDGANGLAVVEMLESAERSLVEASRGRTARIPDRELAPSLE